MLIKQLSVFLENEKGTLSRALGILADNGIDIVALSLAENSEYGILRLIVSDPVKGKEVLRDGGIAANLTGVIAIRVPHDVGSLYRVIQPLADQVNIEYMYAFANGADASCVIKVTDTALAERLLSENGVKVWTEEEAYTLNRRLKKS